MSITIAIPTYNRAGELAPLLRSIVLEAEPDDELIVCDDASDDNTAEVVASHPPFRLNRHRTRLGMVGNWNSCLKTARKDWICIIHDDDRLQCGGLRHVRRALAMMNEPGVLLLRSDANSIDVRFRCRLSDPGPWAILNCPPGPSGAVVHRAIVNAGHLFNPAYPFSPDLDFFPRLCGKFASVVLESPRVIESRLHENNYRFETWRDGQFLLQLESIERGIVALLDVGRLRSECIVEERMHAHLAHMLEEARRTSDRHVERLVKKEMKRRAVTTTARKLTRLMFAARSRLRVRG